MTTPNRSKYTVKQLRAAQKRLKVFIDALKQGKRIKALRKEGHAAFEEAMEAEKLPDWVKEYLEAKEELERIFRKHPEFFPPEDDDEEEQENDPKI